MLFIFLPPMHSYHMIRVETVTMVFSQALFFFLFLGGEVVCSLLFTISQTNSGWKGPQKASSLTCSDQGQTSLLRALSGQVLKSLQGHRLQSLSGHAIP